MPEMVVPKSSHDRFCSKQSSPNARSTITICESEIEMLSNWWFVDIQFEAIKFQYNSSDSEIVMVDLGFGDDLFEQNRSWDDFGTIISNI